MNFPEEIKKKCNEHVELIRDYARSQKDLWQQVPYLALQSYGRGGFGDIGRACYTEGYWTITSSQMSSIGGYSIIVDCETGELVYPYKKTPAPDQCLLLININDLNAEKVIEELKEHAKWQNSEIERFRFLDSSCKTPEEWREKEAQKYGIHPDKYVRPEEIRKRVTAGG